MKKIQVYRLIVVEMRIDLTDVQPYEIGYIRNEVVEWQTWMNIKNSKEGRIRETKREKIGMISIILIIFYQSTHTCFM